MTNGFKQWAMLINIIPLFFLSSSAQANGSVTAAEKVASEFYEAYLKTSESGLPSQESMKKLSRFFSQKLNQLLAEAKRKQADHAKQYPNEKPPLIEGDLFSSLFEGPTGYSVESVSSKNGFCRVVIRFVHADPQIENGKPSSWKDAVIVKQENGRWVIDDIEYLGEWEFKPGKKLSEVLAFSDS